MTMPIANHRPRRRLFALSIERWVAHLMETYPCFDEYDLSQMVEKKTGFSLDERGLECIRALYVRSKLRAWFPKGAEVGQSA